MGTHPIFESDFDCLTEMNRIPSRLKNLRFILLRSKRQNSELTKYKRSTQNLPTQKELKTYIEEITRNDKITTSKERTLRRVRVVATILFSGLFFLTFIWYYEYIGGFFAKIRRAYDLSSNSETSLYQSLKKVFQTDFSSILLSPRDLFSVSAITNDDKIGVGDVVLSKAPR